MAGQEVAGLNVASAGINFIKAMMDFSASGTLADGFSATREWLLRERLSEGAFNACIELAAGCAHPNKHGLELQKGIEMSNEMILKQIRKAPLQLVVSGSLGRLVGRKPEVAYMVTTVTALTKVHTRDQIVEIVSSMILDRGGHETKVQAKFDVRRTLIRATIEKIVDSIYVNVSNAGHKLDDLPPELAGLHQHLLDDRSFAAIVMGINRSQGDIVVRSDRFLVNLTLWLLYHFEGTIEIYVCSELIFKEQRGQHNRRLRLNISYRCSKDAERVWNDECRRRPGRVEASVGTGRHWRTFVNGEDDTKHRPVSHERQSLYDLDNLLSSPLRRSVNITHEQRKRVSNVARQILKWFFQMPLSSEWTLPGLIFMLEPRKESTLKDKTVADLFARTPEMLQKAVTVTTFIDGIDWDEVDAKYTEGQDSSDEDKDPETLPAPLPTDLGAVVHWFPLLRDLLEKVRPDCVCRACRSQQPLDLCRSGCKRYDSFCRFCLELVHGLCDAVGADHVSGQVDIASLIQGLIRLLRKAITSNMICWDDIFVLTASAITGKTISLGLDDPQDSATLGQGNYMNTSLYGAVQYGSLVVAASWLDISDDLRQIRPFSISIHEGNVLGVSDDFAMIACEAMDHQELNPIPTPEKTLVDDIIPNEARQADVDYADIYAAVFPYGEQQYRLMTCVTTGARLAVVDPSRVVAGHWHSSRILCAHRGATLNPEKKATTLLKVYRFEAAYTAWRVHDLPELSVSTRLDTHLKLNALLSLISSATICDAEYGCLDCAFDKLDKFAEGRFLVTFAKTSRLELSRSRTVPVQGS